MIDQHSETWRQVAAHIAARIEKLRDELEKRTKTDEDTTFHRGQLNALREVLALKDKAPDSPPHDKRQ